MTDIALDKRAKFAAQLRNAANEMRVEDHNGWPVLCDIVADYLDASASPSQVAPQPQAGEPVAVGYVDPADTARKSSVGEPLRFWCSPVKTTCFSMPIYASPQPANPAQVTDAMVTKALSAFEKDHPHNRAAMRAALTAAIGAGGQAVAESLWVPAKPEHKKIGWTYDFDQTERLSRAAEKATGYDATMEVIEFVMAEADRRHKSALSQPHPADERVVEALERLREATNRRKVGQPYLVGGSSPEAIIDHAIRALDLSMMRHDMVEDLKAGRVKPAISKEGRKNV